MRVYRGLCCLLALAAAAPGGRDAAAQQVPPMNRPAASPAAVAQAGQLARRGEELLRQGKFAEAAALFRQAAELTPDDWALWDRAGWAYLDAGQAAPALQAFEQLRKTAPAGTPTHGGILISHFALGDLKECSEWIRRLLPPPQADRAIAVVAKGLAAKPRSPDWNFALGYLYARVLGNSPRGLVYVEDVVEANPKHAEAWLLLVEINRQLDRGPQEDAAAIKYLELAPETPEAYRLRAERFASLQKFAEAIAEYEAGIAKHPEADELYYQLARIHERLGGVRQAESVYRRLLEAAATRKLDLVHAQARLQLANFQTRQRNYAEAERYWREMAQKPDASAAVWSSWGALLALCGKWEEAAAALETAAAREEKERGLALPADRDDLLAARYRAAVCRIAAGQRDRAKAGLEAALAMRGETRSTPEIEATAFLAWLEGRGARAEALAYRRSDERWAAFLWRQRPPEGELEVRGRFSPAATAWRAILQEIQKRAADCWPADYALARIYAAGGFSEEAIRLLERTARARPDWWAPHYALGQYYAAQRRKEPGLAAFRRVLQLAPDCRQARVYLSLLADLKDDE